MRYFLGLDIGTTCCKCQVFAESGEILFYRATEYELLRRDDGVYADADAIVRIVKTLISEGARTARIDSVAVSSFGESFVLLDQADHVLFPPMLYTDPRGTAEAEELRSRFGEERLYRTTGVLPQAMFSLPKLLYIRKNMPEIFARAKKVLLIGDYIGYILTGERVIDYALAARTGAFDVQQKSFAHDLLGALGIGRDLFSAPRPAGSVVGKVRKNIAGELGLPESCGLVLGSHDQVCAALGAGVLRSGDAADGIGTVECITTVFDNVPQDIRMGRMGYPVIPFAAENTYCTYALSFACGALVSWFRKRILHDYAGDQKNFFAYMDHAMPDAPSRLLALPYFAGAATPYQDIDARGAIIGLSLDTSDGEVYRALLESTAYEMRLNLETLKNFGITVTRATATGGGANAARWLQIKSDVTRLPLRTLRSSEGGLCGTAILQAYAQGMSFDDAAKVFARYADSYLPQETYTTTYDAAYRRYQTLYRKIKEI